MSDTTLLTPEEVARMLRVHPQTLRRWRMDHEGPPFIAVSERIIRYKRDDVSEWLNENWRTVEEVQADEF